MQTREGERKSVFCTWGIGISSEDLTWIDCCQKIAGKRWWEELRSSHGNVRKRGKKGPLLMWVIGVKLNMYAC